MLLLQPLKPHRLLWSFPLLFCCFSQRQIIRSVGLACGLHLPVCDERVSPILAHGLQRHEAWLHCLLLALQQQTLVDERGDAIQDQSWLVAKSRIERCYGLQRSATHKDGKTPEESLFPYI